MPPKIIPVLEIKDFVGAIKLTDNKRRAKDNVKLILEHLNHMKLDMPQVALDKLVDFLKTEEWQHLHFGMWMVISAIWPGTDVIVKLTKDMSKLWGVQFPRTKPWFPPKVSSMAIDSK
ncbi:hypothetical protein FOCG_14042 [Fusarium oxysporum f. sp. radicis-lycopersici 26381]|uniref:Uncharacterized protein n=2 Tax=Fusarium oxysporum TaxID=5507 RepID=A0A4Q2VM55_FUSOX|nr:uncharacterized protein FOBCDRAFT_313714 [Fusarium oxysporum Fo47]EWZ90889.1 hypothetical protein FOWG_06681 [Fusarium oxysporum f. sp. lycopersici MN25]EXL43676.1 hypothetical protein FOCG_14042 [Fusarium oxysporum f. sp. radicis-lycopersici 26381]RYC87520.1 hypothetical protein BFJ63_vAg9681 [Fusarium oxysporum f. sp. narcissi]EWZ51637.1 hypothetical protein FOZG_01654 [Fusarium oxysporum Fo47]QKD47046.2 hypothetical protein FOBCDRAFT_313714 [Fusarium oxysporum Fo47]